MKTTLHLLTIFAVMLISIGAFAQPPGPYAVNISGIYSDCPPNSGFVQIQTVQNTLPSINEIIPLDANCSFSVTYEMSSLNGYFTLSFPCNGALQNVNLNYSVNVLVPDSTFLFATFMCNNTGVDCLGVPNGSAIPGSSCDDNDPNTANDIWSADCVCAGQTVNPGECNADFWVLQGFTYGPGSNPNTIDSTVVIPIANEIWVWNLSTGNGSYSFLWNFGDGSSSTEAFPTHIYDTSGPYTLCLTITDGSGCTDTYCDSISVNGDGIFEGMAGIHEQDEFRTAMTLNVRQEQPVLSVSNESLSNAFSLWPNPVQDMINLSVSTKHQDQIIMSITDMNGKVISQLKNNLRSGENKLQINTNDLMPGMYILQLTNGNATTTRRFVKQ